MAIKAPSPQPIEVVLAESLAYWMVQKGFTAQARLAERAGVDQKTISNCLNPGQRLASITGKDNTPKLGTVHRIAQALDVPLWVLLKPMPANEPGFAPAAQAKPHLRVVREKAAAK